MNFNKLSILLIGLLFFMACEEEESFFPNANLPSFSIADISVDEGKESFQLTAKVVLSGENNANAIVNYSTLDGSALAGEDFRSVEGQLIFSPDETEKNISIKINGDDLVEGDEQFEILLFNPVNATIEKEKAVVLLKNDDEVIDNSLLVIPAEGYSTPMAYEGLELIWQDEFQATELNLDDWTFELGNGSNGWGNNELQSYQTENLYFAENEYMVIEARKEAKDGFQYTSSRIKTQGKKQFKYGRIDIRAAMPEGQGLWPALWMLGANFNAVGWPICGEIDIMEMVGRSPGQVYSTVHYGTSVATRQSNGNSKVLPGGERLSEEFHVYSLIWKEDLLQFMVDDVMIHEVSAANISPYPFNAPFFFIFNVAVGGTFPGNPDDQTVFPQRMIVDYVRVFQ